MDLKNLVDGRLVPPVGSRYLDVFEPATGKIYARCPASDVRDVAAAVSAARRAAPEWAGLRTVDRAKHLRTLADAIESDADEFAREESRDTGKPVALARAVDITRSVTNLRFFADAVTQWGSETYADSGVINITLRQPLGVVGCISPWNLPLYLFTWKIAPALAVGNTVVAKPSEVTPYTAFHLSQLVGQSGFPRGALNIVHGTGPSVGQAIVDHELVRAVSFTGSTRTGSSIAASTAPSLKKISLEMGGKNPTIIFDDADLSDENLSTIVRSGFSNQGEICLCGSRVLVQRGIYDQFKERYLDGVRHLKVGDPNDASSDLGAIVSKPHYEKVTTCIARALAEGGTVACGGESPGIGGRCSGGWFVSPTVIEGLPQNCSTNCEEIFGPVVTLIPFEDENDAVSIANSTDYGLAASVWTRDISCAHRVSQAIDFGIVWVNCWMVRDLRTPFGGAKRSGYGREGGADALRFFTEPKDVCISV